jgi:hypothetical protein
MWQVHAMLALDIARERAEEARAQALANAARSMAEEERRLHGVASSASRTRAVAARALRAISGASASLSGWACDAATRLDRRTA